MLRSLLVLLRPHHWLKNLLVVVPLVTSFSIADPSRQLACVLAFLSLCLVASGTYIVNDLIDLPHDRAHPAKRLRPLAAGDVSIGWAVVMASVWIVGGLVVATQVGVQFAVVVVSYVLITLLYSRFLKAQALLDVLVLVVLWNLRIYAGAVAIQVELSVWLLSFGVFLFLSLSLLKRATELRAATSAAAETVAGRGYRPSDLALISQMGQAAALAALVVLALFVDSSSAQWRYPHPERLWLICPPIWYWLSRLWLKMHRGEMHHDPVVFSLKDRASWLAMAGVVGALVLAHLGT
jgi:4-hydroxybenzoate polyprenyltransferase